MREWIVKQIRFIIKHTKEKEKALPLVWNLGPKRKKNLPSELSIQLCNYRKMELKEPTLKTQSSSKNANLPTKNVSTSRQESRSMTVSDTLGFLMRGHAELPGEQVFK